MLLRALTLTAIACAAAAPVTLRNDVPRVDTDGDIISAGDGCISYQPDEQLYYLFGAHYQPCAEPNTDCYAGPGGIGKCQQHTKVDAGLCCGWRNATIAAWSSPDLSTWKKEGLNILPILTGNESLYSSEYMAVFEPCGAFNRKTQFWSLFFLRDGYVLARAVARKASGPFEVLEWTVPVPEMTRIVDFYFWQNATTGDLIMKHNSQQGGEFAVTFSEDYLNITASSPVFGHEQGYTEGGGIFQHGGDSFVMAGYGCCFCTDGSNGFLWRSQTGVLGDYALLGDKIPRYPNHTSVTHAQQFSVTPVYTREGVVPMFVGIRFGSAPDFRKDHDYQFWAPLLFDANNDMLNVSWVDQFTLDLVPPPAPSPLPPPPAPWYACALSAPGTCFEVPAGAFGAHASLAACESACAPWWACTPDGGGGGDCQPVAAGSPGALPTASACAASCVLCDVSGDWVGTEKSVGIRISEGAVAANKTAGIVISTVPGGVWTSNASGRVYTGGLQVTGGWCGGGTCMGTTGRLRPDGPPCALIDWGGAGTWCKPAADSQCS